MATSASEAMPSQMVKVLNWMRTTNPTSDWMTSQIAACVRDTRPLAMGRLRVRATFKSMSRSTMSLKVQPAPRMAMAPIRNSTSDTKSNATMGWATATSPSDIAQGQKSNSKPIGRSQRARRA